MGVKNLKINLCKKEFLYSIFLLTIGIFFLFCFSLMVNAQNISINQLFGLSLLYNDNSINLAGLESANLLVNAKNENFIFYTSFYFTKYEFYYEILTSLNYSFFINQIWLRLPFGNSFLDLGIKPEIDIDQTSIDLFAPYLRLVYTNSMSFSSFQNRFQFSYKIFITDQCILNLKWYPDYKLESKSENIFLINIYNFFDPLQFELFGIYYEFSGKSRLAFSIKFPLILNWLLSSAIHFDSDFKYRFFETKVQAYYQFFNKFYFTIFWYYTSFVFSLSEFSLYLSNVQNLNNLDELLTIDNNLFGLNINLAPDPFFSFNLYTIFTISPFDILFSLSINFLFSNTLKLKISYISNFTNQQASTLNYYWIIFLKEFKGIVNIEIFFNII